MFLVLFLTCLIVHNIECKFDNRIVDGQPIDITSIPFQLSLHLNGRFHCGAILITPGIALTAAHCVYSKSPELLTVHAGSNYTQSSTKRKISWVKTHPNYAGCGNDIAMLWFEKEVEITKEINIAKLPKPNFEVPVGANVTVTGWGHTDATRVLSEVLLSADLLIVDREYCKKKYSTVLMEITDSMLCAGVDNGIKDSCHGDSGGPLVFEDVLIGIVSCGLACGHPGIPGIYTQVSRFISFINNSIAEHM